MRKLEANIDHAIHRIQVWERSVDHSLYTKPRRWRAWFEYLLVWFAIGFIIGFVTVVVTVG